MTPHVNRRELLTRAAAAGAVTGAAWVTPSVLGSAAVFAAASPHTCPSDESLAFVAGKPTVNPPGWPSGYGNGVDGNPANNNGWVFTEAGLDGDDALGVFTGYHPGPVPQFVVERNPRNTGTQNNPNVSGALVTYTHTLGPLWDATTYTFTSDIYSVDTNYYPQLLDVQILDSSDNVVATLGRYRTDPTPANNGTHTMLTPDTWTTYSWTFNPATDGTYQIRFRFTFTNFATGGSNNNASNARVGDDIAVTAPTVTCA